MDNFFGDPYMMWHDGINPATAARLKGEEREKGMELLIESMQGGCYWAPMGLREMNATKAIPIMKELLSKSSSLRQRIEIAHALNVLEKTNKYVDIIIDVLQNAGFWTSRMSAAIMLRQYNTSEVIDALYGSVQDIDYIVRNHSAESLLHIHGLPASISQYKEIFQEIIVEVGKGDVKSIEEAKKHYERAAEMLREVIEESKE